MLPAGGVGAHAAHAHARPLLPTLPTRADARGSTFLTVNRDLQSGGSARTTGRWSGDSEIARDFRGKVGDSISEPPARPLLPTLPTRADARGVPGGKASPPPLPTGASVPTLPMRDRYCPRCPREPTRMASPVEKPRRLRFPPGASVAKPLSRPTQVYTDPRARPSPQGASARPPRLCVCLRRWPLQGDVCATLTATAGPSPRRALPALSPASPFVPSAPSIARSGSPRVIEATRDLLGTAPGRSESENGASGAAASSTLKSINILRGSAPHCGKVVPRLLQDNHTRGPRTYRDTIPPQNCLTGQEADGPTGYQRWQHGHTGDTLTNTLLSGLAGPRLSLCAPVRCRGPRLCRGPGVSRKQRSRGRARFSFFSGFSRDKVSFVSPHIVLDETSTKMHQAQSFF